ncbi:glycosyltransferase family 4 protein [Frateuria aurantia]
MKKQLHIGIDGFNLALPQGTGVATYARNLANTLSDMGHRVSTIYGAPISPKAPPLLQEVQFYDYLGGAKYPKPFYKSVKQYIDEAIRAPFGAKAIHIPFTGKVERRRFNFNLPRDSEIFNAPNLFNMARAYFMRHGRFLELKIDNPPDIMHWTYPLPIRIKGIPNIYTIHDLVPLKLPYTTLDNKRYYYRLIKNCIAHSSRICTVSRKSKEDIESMFPEAIDKITNTYQAASIDAGAQQQLDAELRRDIQGLFSLEKGSYFLFFGAIEPKKNVGRLIEAYLSSRMDTPLIIAGAQAWKSKEELKLYTSLIQGSPNIQQRIRLLGYLPYPFLNKLIKGAKAVAFPSLYEGFGLPVLEAMQMGTPTLCSQEGSLPEVAGNASIFVNPYSTDSIADGMTRLDRDVQLCNDLSQKGRQQCLQFSVECYGNRLRELYS